MKLLKFSIGEDTRVGLVKGDRVAALSSRDALDALHCRDDPPYTGETFPLTEVRYLPPVVPSKIICLGQNYLEHAREMGGEPPTQPMIFYKPPSALIGHGEDIVLPSQSEEVHNEVELAVVIGRRTRNVSAEAALDCVGGYTVILDITARDIQQALKARGQQWAIAKSFDTFAPLGPWLVSAAQISDPGNLWLRLRVNSKVRQEANTSEMMFSVPETISYLSSVMTLEPGDVIATGTPRGVGAICHGDVLEAEIEGIGLLRNHVIKG